MIDFKILENVIGKLGGTLQFFPGDVNARIGIIEEIAEMAGDIDQVRWLVREMPKRFDAWPGMRETRALFCKKFRPRDGIEAYSAVYIDGFPAENKPAVAALPATKRRELGPASVDSSASAVVRDLVPATSLKLVEKLPVKLSVKLPTEDEIAEIKRLQALRAEREETRRILAGELESQASS